MIFILELPSTIATVEASTVNTSLETLIYFLVSCGENVEEYVKKYVEKKVVVERRVEISIRLPLRTTNLEVELKSVEEISGENPTYRLTYHLLYNSHILAENVFIESGNVRTTDSVIIHPMTDEQADQYLAEIRECQSSEAGLDVDSDDDLDVSVEELQKREEKRQVIRQKREETRRANIEKTRRANIEEEKRIRLAWKTLTEELLEELNRTEQRRREKAKKCSMLFKPDISHERLMEKFLICVMARKDGKVFDQNFRLSILEDFTIRYHLSDIINQVLNTHRTQFKTCLGRELTETDDLCDIFFKVIYDSDIDIQHSAASSMTTRRP